MRLTEKVQDILRHTLTTGEIAIDATAGNGYDTLGMAQAVGPDGRVIAIDIQQAALNVTRERLDQAGFTNTCDLRLGDHSKILASLEDEFSQQVKIITFNLGYLPGSDKAIQTTSETTLPALSSACRLLKPNGQLLVTAYRGHPGGLSEAAAVADFFTQLPASEWTCQTFEPKVNSDRVPPILHVAMKLK
jgi:Methylase involved in ubiquinone/menaquinone biosynthesis